MIPVPVHTVAQIVNGRLQRVPSEFQLIRDACIDSRAVLPDSLFVALPGAAHHGIDFVQAARDQGAAAVLCDAQAVQRLRESRPDVWCELSSNCSSGTVLLEVDDVRAALQTLSVHNRRRAPATRLAVTGSVGKTTTRQMISAVLNGFAATVQSPANYNNELGVPLSLLKLAAHHQFAVLELGASAQGEIAALAALCEPRMAVVTEVSAAHLDGFGDLEGVQRAKAELPAALPADGVVFLNGDNPRVRGMAAFTQARVCYFGMSPGCDVRATAVEACETGCRLRIDGQQIRLPACGRHLALAALAAFAVGREVGIPPGTIRDALCDYVPDPGRGFVHTGLRWMVIDESYNASPASMAAAVQQLVDRSTRGRRILVLGDMHELGNDSARFHQSLGQLIGRSPIDHVLLIGEMSSHTAEGIRDVVPDQLSVRRFEDSALLHSALRQLVSVGDVILVKGSRSLRLERTVSFLVTLARSAADDRAEMRDCA